MHRFIFALVLLTLPVSVFSEPDWDALDVIDGPNPTLRYGFYTESGGQVRMGRYYFIENDDQLRLRFAPYGKTPVELPVSSYDQATGKLIFGWDGRPDRTCELHRQNDRLFLGNCIEPLSVLPIAIRTADERDMEWMGAHFPVSVEDLEILERAKDLFEFQVRRNRQGDRNCDEDLARGQLSLFCALYAASIEVTGVYRHRRPAMRTLRQEAYLRYPGEYAHSLRDINNRADIDDDDLIDLIESARRQIEQQLEPTQPRALPAVEPEAVGMMSERLERFDTLAAEYVEEGRVAGIVALVIRNDAVVHTAVHGAMDVETGEPMRNDSIFRIASQTKLVTSVATMMLVESGRLRLDEPVASFLPAYEGTTVAIRSQDGGDGGDGDENGVELVPAVRPITIRDLLTHTAGISGGSPGHSRARYAAAMLPPGRNLLNDLDEPVADVVHRLGSLPFSSQPGEAWVYGFSTDVLGAVIEVAGGMALDDFFRTRIFEPLGMVDTHFFLPPEKADRLVATHILEKNGAIGRASDDDMSWDGQGAFVQGPRRLFQASGGLLSTASDFARFLQMVLNGGSLDGVRILSPTSVRLMTANHVGDLYADFYPGMGFGFNVEVKLDLASAGYQVPAAASVGAYGWGGAAYTRFWVDPDQALIGVFMTQTRPTTGDLHERFGNIVYGAIASPTRH